MNLKKKSFTVMYTQDTFFCQLLLVTLNLDIADRATVVTPRLNTENAATHINAKCFPLSIPILVVETFNDDFKYRTSFDSQGRGDL